MSVIKNNSCKFFIFILLLGPFTQTYSANKIDSLFALLQTEKTDTGRINLRFKIAGILFKEDTVAVKREVNFILAGLKKIGDKNFILKSYDKLGRLFYNNKLDSRANEYYKNGLRIAKENKLNEWIVKFYMRLANVMQNDGLSKQSIAYFDSAITYTTGLSEKTIADVYKSKGRAHYDIGEYKIAMHFYVLSQKIYEKNNLLTAEYGYLLHYIGSVFKRQNQYSLALEYYEKELALARKIKDTHLEAEALYLCAAMYGEKGLPEKEIEYELKALAIYKAEGNEQAEALILGNISGYYGSIKEYQKAVDYCLQALEIYKHTGDGEKEAWVYNSLGHYYANLGEHKKAMAYLNKAEEAVMKVETKQLLYLTDIKRDKAFLFADLNNYKEAFENLLDHQSLKDSLENKENREYLHTLATQYETEKKEKEIELLNKDKAVQVAEIATKENQRNFLVIVVVLVLIIAGFSIYAFVNKKRITRILAQQVDEINLKNHEIQEKNKDITDSIQYAKRLQDAVFPDPVELTNFFEEAFILFRPKDIVSGDFYWFEEFGNKALLVVGDCTGHGVPGAFMSIMGHNLLNTIVLEEKVWEPAQILKLLDQKVMATLNKKMSTQSYREGMDMAILLINKRENKITFAGANRPLLINRNGNVIEYKANKFAIGGGYDTPLDEGYSDSKKLFTQHEVKLQENDLLYMFSDGYHDQFGGPKGKKFKYKYLQEVLMTTAQNGLRQQGEVLETMFEEWKGSLEQLDDVTVVGIKLS